ncbi:MAG: hypothetical protein JWP15_2779 [Alphaproteobacteria bacterium]|nr:hypothetical protein [Alphaproteobacteria bacterium]
MNNEHLHHELVELGVVSIDTRGALVGREDTDIGQQFVSGLTDD